ncbi:MFS transporter [Rhizobium sp. S152]|uniref:MFS transporter n=1 Tax=Rhizobium sp. S152 TaxID=3055038 RepID=UPI0025A9FBA9|nr:MFS transporter [Rhizobium sp. S152]MDM9629080.1 MFS transporter [Rhizobium sp. S152]
MSSSLRSTQTIAVLAVTQLIGWGTTFDMLGVMGRVIAPELGLANEIVFGGLTIMMIVSAIIGPVTGRLLERHGAARVLAASSIVFAIGLLLLAVSHGIVLYAISWVVIGIGAALCLTAPTYTAVVEREGANSKRVIAILMLFTGLSSAIFWPVLSLLTAEFGWRLTFVISAALHLFICLPLYLLALPRPLATQAANAQMLTPPVQLSASDRRNAFLLIAATTTISTFVTFGLAPSLLEVLRQYGASPALALQLGSARGVIGISARGMDMLLGKRGSPIVSATMGIGLMVTSFALILVIPPSTALLVGFILIYSFGSGVMAVARALLPLALFSPREYGLQAARLSLPQNIANAVAPVIFTALLDRTGASTVMAVCGVLAAVSLGFVTMLAMLIRRARPVAQTA